MDQQVNNQDVRDALTHIVSSENVELIGVNISIKDHTAWTFTLSGQSYPTTFGFSEVNIHLSIGFRQSPDHLYREHTLAFLEKKLAEMLEFVGGVFQSRYVTYSPISEHVVEYILCIEDVDSLKKLSNYSFSLFEREFTQDLEKQLQED